LALNFKTSADSITFVLFMYDKSDKPCEKLIAWICDSIGEAGQFIFNSGNSAKIRLGEVMCSIDFVEEVALTVFFEIPFARRFPTLPTGENVIVSV
jgi:hypothetical protein